MTIRIAVGLLFAATLMIGWNNAHAFLGMARVTIKVVDEEGQALEGINVGVGFETSRDWRTDIEGQQGQTDADGKFSISGECNGHISYGADKAGHYDSYYVYDFQKKGLLGWEPHNPELTVVLRKIGKQVPMYARDTDKSRIEIPETDKDIGFDLIKFDWVAPYGGGAHSDFIFHLKKQRFGSRRFEYNLDLKFANKDDGILPFNEDLQYGSVFKLPREAPLSGFLDGLMFFRKRTDNYAGGSWEKNKSYIFRIRSSQDDAGNVQGIYGKIIGDIDIGGRKKGTAYIKFKYYVNPDGTRNLEYDPKQNLFNGLTPREWVGIK